MNQEDIIEQLKTFGYGDRDQISNAIKHVNDPNDINQIVDYLTTVDETKNDIQNKQQTGDISRYDELMKLRISKLKQILQQQIKLIESQTEIKQQYNQNTFIEKSDFVNAIIKLETDEVIINQLLSFQYDKTEIINAINSVQNRHDINEITNYINAKQQQVDINDNTEQSSAHIDELKSKKVSELKQKKHINTNSLSQSKMQINYKHFVEKSEYIDTKHNPKNVETHTKQKGLEIKTMTSEQLERRQNINLTENTKNTVAAHRMRCMNKAALALLALSKGNRDDKISVINWLSSEEKVDPNGKNKILTSINPKPISKISNGKQKTALFHPNGFTNTENKKIFREMAETYKKHANNLTFDIDSSYLLNPPLEEKPRTRKQSEQKCALSECEHLLRITETLRKYHDFVSQSSHNKKNSIHNIYDNYNVTCIRNDFHHLLDIHNHEFDDIYDIFVEQSNNNKICNMSNCVMMQRNHRDRNLYINNDIIK
eukprot:506623_1